MNDRVGQDFRRGSPVLLISGAIKQMLVAALEVS